jgi:hypothetical protein
MRITSGGDVGIGSSTFTFATSGRTNLVLNGSTSSLLEFQNGGSASAYLFSSSTSLEINAYSSRNMLFTTNGSERMRITSGGQVYVGTTGGLNGTLNSVTLSGQYALSLFDGFGNSAMVSIRNSSNTEVGSITIISGTATAYNTTSDYRLKQDLKDFKGLELISAIKTYDYEWKSNKTRMYGVLAHELSEVIDYAVTGVKDGKDMQQVDYSKIVPVLIKAIQEQQTQIEQLKNK